MYTLREIGKRSVISVEKGVIIGTVDDVQFSEDDARVKAFLVYGRPRLFGLLGRDSDVRIAWEEIVSIGRDVILVRTPVQDEATSQQHGTRLHQRQK